MNDWLSDMRLKRAALFGSVLGYLAVTLLSWVPAIIAPILQFCRTNWSMRWRIFCSGP